MIEHIVLFKLRDGWTPEDAATLKKGLLSLKEKIGGIEYASAGLDFCGRAKGYDFGYIARFSSREAYDIYGPHPEHDAFIAAHKHLWTDVLALDYLIAE
jgi:hypothetical protein